MRSLRSVFSLLLLAILAGCNVADSSHSDSGEYDKVRENVWAYVQSTGMLREEESENAWLNGEIEETKLEENIYDYSNLPDKYHGKTVFLVTPSFKPEREAYPTIIVSPETKRVIGVLPGV